MIAKREKVKKWANRRIVAVIVWHARRQVEASATAAYRVNRAKNIVVSVVFVRMSARKRVNYLCRERNDVVARPVRKYLSIQSWKAIAELHNDGSATVQILFGCLWHEYGNRMHIS